MQSDTNFFDGSRKSSANTVQLVDEDDPWDMIMSSLRPHLFRLCFDAGNSIKNTYSTIQDAKRAKYFESEVGVAGCVDEVDVVRSR